MNDVARVRIRSVRFKNGGEVRLLPSLADRTRQDVERHIRHVLDCQERHGGIAGFAIVVWGRDGGSSADKGDSTNLPHIAIPDMVRNRLLAFKIEEWARS